MIELMSAMLVKYIREGGQYGLEVSGPVNLMWADDTARDDMEKQGESSIDFPVQCIALVYVTGGNSGEEITVAGALRGPEGVPDVTLDASSQRWPDKARTFALIVVIDAPVKMSNGGLYKADIEVNGTHLVSLPFYIVWKDQQKLPA